MEVEHVVRRLLTSWLPVKKEREDGARDKI
jgi:hypothetical protein